MTFAMFGSDSICGNVNRSFPRFNPDTVAEMWADSIVDDAGYASREDLVLSRSEKVDRLFPTANELRALRLDVVKLAACFQEKLIKRELFIEDLNSGATVDELNDALGHLLEGSDAFRAHPDDALDRNMHYQGCCDCRVG